MRFTNKLCAQHLGWMFKKHWQIQGKRVARDTGAASELAKLGIEVKNPKDVLKEPRSKQNFERLVFAEPLITQTAEDAFHPNWHAKPCHVYGDSNVLLEGVAQAQILTKTIEINGFPKNIEETISKMQLNSNVDKNIQNSIMASHVLDAEQVKLPKIKIPERPAFTLPREYGISHNRRRRLLINKLIFECEKLSGSSVTSRRQIFDNAAFNVSLTKDGDLLQFELSADTFMTSAKPIEAVKGKYETELPDLYPIKHTITIPKKNIYTTKNSYPLRSALPCSHPHTIFVHFDKENVKNLHQTPVTTSQFQARNLLKAFTVASARAKQLYGESVEQLPKPIVVQSIQTDGQTFHFGVYQLNTLQLSGLDGIKNYWFHLPNVDLFAECGYKVGRPVLEGYNKDCFRYLKAFYSNC
ncbi:39S ribosomal protein L37, mitochondrial [Episyrphus balteatus]|uniref:39S ribosomal protein L37, mitochondrial n=1 Tax=Episyrphus balteatus TaxID=286459 RepID=UPI0024863484|nr:39S ribosomal protein L37, mitochondrial [Episyrphus balteatus]